MNAPDRDLPSWVAALREATPRAHPDPIARELARLRPGYVELVVRKHHDDAELHEITDLVADELVAEQNAGTADDLKLFADVPMDRLMSFSKWITQCIEHNWLPPGAEDVGSEANAMNDRDSDLFAEDAIDVLRRRIDTAILEYLRAAHGPGAVLNEPYPKPADLVQAMQVAHLVSDRALLLRLDWAKKARGKGTPWQDLVDPLGIDTIDEWTDGPLEAFRLVAGPPPMPHDPIRAHWTCASCDGWITDSGPSAGDPVDAEVGHVENCERHARDITAYRAQRGE